MRRFSQRNALVTLSDINITPLLDLAFVLLIIFVITTPLFDPNGITVNLPKGGKTTTQVSRDDLRVVSVDKDGRYFIGREQLSLAALEQRLVQEARANPELVVRIRADEESRTRHFYPVIDVLLRNNITRISLATDPSNRR